MKPLLVLLSLLLVTGLAIAQDPVTIAPDAHNVLLENDHVRVYEFHAGSGVKVPMHSHPNHVVYFLTDGNVRFTTPDGKTRDMEAKSGTSVWVDPTTHAVENIGKEAIKAVLIEMKDMAGMKKMEPKK
jgi:quercetin dioxygenase-like cupin family protein